jgi:hypothetical protein
VPNYGPQGRGLAGCAGNFLLGQRDRQPLRPCDRQ